MLDDQAISAADGFGNVGGFRLVRISDVEPKTIHYIDDDRMIPTGMLTLLAGDPGLGKSTFCCALAGKVTREGGEVLFLTAEDSYSHVVRPRLEAAEANL